MGMGDGDGRWLWCMLVLGCRVLFWCPRLMSLCMGVSNSTLSHSDDKEGICTLHALQL